MKMKKYEKIKNSLIDKFYAESNFVNIEEEYTMQANKFEKDLYNLKDKFEIVKEYKIKIQIDIKDIVEKGVEVKEAKIRIIEMILFSFISTCILILYVLAINTLGIKFFVTFQVLLSAFLPWVVVIFSLIAKKKGEIA